MSQKTIIKSCILLQLLAVSWRISSINAYQNTALWHVLNVRNNFSWCFWCRNECFHISFITSLLLNLLQFMPASRFWSCLQDFKNFNSPALLKEWHDKQLYSVTFCQFGSFFLPGKESLCQFKEGCCLYFLPLMMN